MTASPPSERVSTNDLLATSQVRELASGIDALYLSGRGTVPKALLDTLEELRQTVGAENAAYVFLCIGEVECGDASIPSPAMIDLQRYPEIVATSDVRVILLPRSPPD